MELFHAIVSDLKKFVQFFNMKYKYDQRGILKRLRLKSGLNKQLTEDKWCNLFIQKSAYNYCAKFLLIKLYEDNERIPSKINKNGLEKWRNLVENIDEQYEKIYEIACQDMMHIEEMKSVFKECDYDVYDMDNELAEFMINKLSQYSLKSYDIHAICEIFNCLYTEEQEHGLDLKYFYKPANAIEYIHLMDQQEEDLVQ